MLKRVLVVLIIMAVASVAAAAEVPKLMNYQAVLFDDDSNPLQ